jgi:hypothetical protein
MKREKKKKEKKNLKSPAWRLLQIWPSSSFFSIVFFRPIMHSGRHRHVGFLSGGGSRSQCDGDVERERGKGGGAAPDAPLDFSAILTIYRFLRLCIREGAQTAVHRRIRWNAWENDEKEREREKE